MSESRSDAASPPPASPAGRAPATPPPGRYDVDTTGSRTSGRIVALLLIVLVGALIVAGGMALYRFTSTPAISGNESGFEVVADDRVDLRLDVTRDEPSTPVYCIVRAKEYNGAEVGRREVYVPPGDERTVRMPTWIDTTARAFIVDVYGCGDDVPDYLRR